MKLPRFMLCVMVLLAGMTDAMAQQKPAAPRKVKRGAPLFVGSESSGSLKIPSLPTSTELETQAQKLSSRLRNVDPFGLSTFPRDGETPAPADSPARPTERVTLNQALQTLRISGINLAAKEVLIGGRSVFEGDVMMLAFKNEVFLAQVLQVGPAQILFRDVKRQETGALPHTLLPHLEMEPMQTHAAKESLQGKVTAIEPLKPQPR